MKEGGLPQLDPTWYPSQLFWLAISFIFLYIVMSRLIVPRIHNVLETRQDRISHDLDWAASLKGDAENAKVTYESALSDARARAQEMLNGVTKSIKETAEAKNHELDVLLNEKLAESEKEIQQAMNKAQDSLKPVTEEITSLIVEAVIHNNASEDKVQSIVSKIQKEYAA